MKVLVEGPKWVGMWSEIVTDVFAEIGFDVELYYHNEKKGVTRLLSKVNRLLPSTRTLFAWEELKKRDLFELATESDFDLLFSIQGKLDSELIASLKAKKPAMRIIYWLGDVLVPSGARRLQLLKDASFSGQLDLLLVSYQGICDQLVSTGFKNVHFFPFGASENLHHLDPISDEERRQFASQVSFVGTSYPERVELIQFLNRHLETPVRVWGRSWRGTGVKSNGPLCLADSLKVHACSQISLNNHHHLTDGGFNMKFFEIPAVGGFQLCDWQPALDRSLLGQATPSYHSKEMLLEKIQYYLHHDEEREQIARKCQPLVFEEFDYRPRLQAIVEELFNRGAEGRRPGVGLPAAETAVKVDPSPEKTSVAGQKIRVKFLSQLPESAWLRHFPDNSPVWGDCAFTFDPNCREYDWLVVYDDIPPSREESSQLREEALACPRRQSLLVTTEPPSIKAYGNTFTAQFGCVLTSQPEQALPHSDRIFSQPALTWFYGAGSGSERSYRSMSLAPPLLKEKDLATVCSTKRQKHTLHNKRYLFTQELKARIPAMDIYGHGVKPMHDKSEALDAYRYHIAIENYVGKHHWTEKLSDAFLGMTLPFYYGCPNANDYFPAESFIQIDLNDVADSAEIIKRAIRDREYEKRLPYIVEARRLVLEEYNLFAVLAREIERRGNLPGLEVGQTIFSRRSLRKRPVVAARDFYEKCRSKVLFAERS